MVLIRFRKRQWCNSHASFLEEGKDQHTALHIQYPRESRHIYRRQWDKELERNEKLWSTPWIVALHSPLHILSRDLSQTSTTSHKVCT